MFWKIFSKHKVLNLTINWQTTFFNFCINYINLMKTLLIKTLKSSVCTGFATKKSKMELLLTMFTEMFLFNSCILLNYLTMK